MNKVINNKIKSIDKEKMVITIIGSTEDVDRVGDKMYMSGCDLTNYLKNPTVLANHFDGEATEKPTVIGKALSVKVIDKKLIFDIQFAETANGKDWYYLYANKFMNASSIGFIPKKQKPNKTGGYDILEWELLELSLVATPCNQNAIQHAFNKGKISKSMVDILNKNPEQEEQDMDLEKLKAIHDKLDECMKALNEICNPNKQEKEEPIEEPIEEPVVEEVVEEVVETEPTEEPVVEEVVEEPTEDDKEYTEEEAKELIEKMIKEKLTKSI